MAKVKSRAKTKTPVKTNKAGINRWLQFGKSVTNTISAAAKRLEAERGKGKEKTAAKLPQNKLPVAPKARTKQPPSTSARNNYQAPTGRKTIRRSASPRSRLPQRGTPPPRGNKKGIADTIVGKKAAVGGFVNKWLRGRMK